MIEIAPVEVGPDEVVPTPGSRLALRSGSRASRTGLMLLSSGALAAAACGRTAPRSSGAEVGAERPPRCAPHDTASTASADRGRRRFRLDWNGDGIDDLALATAGSVAIWLGSRNGLGDEPAIRLAAPADSNGFGRALMPVGDLDGDGFGDLVVAAPWTITEGERGPGFPEGAAFLYRGGQGVPTPERLAVLGAGMHFGSSLGTGDLDGDGRPEFVVATPTNWTTNIQGRRPQSRAGVDVYGGDLVPNPLWPAEPDVVDVMDIAGGGDLDGDGCDDIVVRVEPAGAVDRTKLVGQGTVVAMSSSDFVEMRVYTGGTGGIDAQHSRVLARSNLKGPPDLLVVPDFDGHGRAAVAFVRDGGVSVARLDPAGGAASRTELAFPVAFAWIGYLATGDFDGDGQSELVAGSHQQGGVIAVYRGGTSAAAPIMLTRPQEARLFPLGLSVGDFDGDGRDDLAATGSIGSAPADQLWIYRGDATSLLEGPVRHMDMDQ